MRIFEEVTATPSTNSKGKVHAAETEHHSASRSNCPKTPEGSVHSGPSSKSEWHDSKVCFPFQFDER